MWEKNKEPNKELVILLQKICELKNSLLTVQCNIVKVILNDKISQIETNVSNIMYEKNTEKVKTFNEELKVNGKFSQNGVWKLKKKLCLKSRDPPMAKKDIEGNLVTNPQLLKELYMDTYKHRLRHRKMNEEYVDILNMKESLWKLRMDRLVRKKSDSWNMEDLDRALSSLKTNQARDPLGMVADIFKPKNIGSELKLAILELMNGVKNNLFVPENMQLASITSIFKNKGLKFELKNDRGIFILTIFRKILDKLLYNDKYTSIEVNMSYSNIGARKKKNIKNHLFIIYAVINSVINGDMDPIDIQVYDLEQAFDALWLEDCLNDMYDVLLEGERDDKLALIYMTNVKNTAYINTPIGVTPNIQLPKIVQQGGVWGPLECSNSVDKIGRNCNSRGINYYKYKKVVNILPLAMVDDLCAISVCGNDSVCVNSYMETHINIKKLKFHTPDLKGKTMSDASKGFFIQ